MCSGYNKLIVKIKEYNPNCDFALIQKSYDLSRNAHKGQQRVSGEPYITHPVEVAIILTDLKLDCNSIISAILHDTIEDTTFTHEELEAEFGSEIALIVDGVTKLGKLQFKSKEEQQAENLRRMFFAMSKDIRVILIKLADRLHNMRTLKYMSSHKQIEKARETLDIFAPLAHRLGISRIKWELEDLCFRYIDPKAYYELVNKITNRRKERETFINLIIDNLKLKTSDIGIETFIDGRPKHLYSIYKKMVSQNKSLEEIYDILAVRVIVGSVKDCYTVLGLVHELYKPLPGRFKDYIAMPKPNMYQSLHTTLISPQGHPFEIQIRTWEMHEVSEFGIAAHWKYKGHGGQAAQTEIDNKLTWLRQLLDWQQEMRDASEFMETLKIDLFTDEVFVFSPKGDVINLRAGSCPIDFAYAIHSAIGNKTMGAKVNGKIVPIDYVLKNGDIIEILTSANILGPSRDWLKIVKTSQARNKINQWHKKEKRDENVIRGKDSVDKEIKKLGIAPNQLLKNEWIDLVLQKYNFLSNDDMYAGIGLGAISPNKVITRLKEEYRKTLKPEELAQQILDIPISKPQKKHKIPPNNGIVVKGIDNCLVRLSRCCNPVPGDEIMGYITRGRGVSVHRNDCPNISNTIDGDNRLIEVSWYVKQNSSYVADLTISAYDRDGLVLEITNIFHETKINLRAINARTTKEHAAIINLTVGITDTEQLNILMKKLRNVKDILEITRKKQ